MRLSQYIYFLNQKYAPTKEEKQMEYTHFEIDAKAMKERREYRKLIRRLNKLKKVSK
tara:strand:- start:180 stop:350 length:171 start_codon:yes stop_codon:yes gene_type:complete